YMDLFACLQSCSLQLRTRVPCHGEPKTCPMPEVPSNGGLACVTLSNTRYCKPMCNHGYDFGFPRMTRLYEDCSDGTWSTMYIGGNKLAVCNKTPFAFVGGSTAYFPEAQDCSTTLANSQLKTKILDDFIAELRKHGKDGEAQHTCLVCG
uniref:Sushi domain-containing protein n=1 Tax=Myripristis murdjan TaxID=586833 RepID=A0A667Y8E8_9TELE